MKTKQLVTALFFAMLYVGVHAQDIALPKLKEYGIGFSGLNNYSLQYRWGTEKKLYRVRGSLNSNSSFGNTSFSSASVVGGSTVTSKASTKMPIIGMFGIGFSVLHLKPIVNNFGVFYGPGCGLSAMYNNSPANSPLYQIDPNGNINTVKTKSTVFNASVSGGAALGAYYKISDKFLVYAEISPGIVYRYNYQKVETTNIVTTATSTDYLTVVAKNNEHNFGFAGIGNSNAMITLVYRVSK